MLRRFPFRILPAVPFLLAITACGIPTTADWRRCSFDVTDVTFQGLRENEAEWRVVVSAFNPNSKRLRLEGLHLWAVMDGDTLARLKNPDPIDLPARTATPLAIEVSLPQAAWNKALRKMRQTGSSEVWITGDAVVPTILGERTLRNAVREKHTIDLSALMGGDFLRNLFFR
jgi:hypothetical protein